MDANDSCGRVGRRGRVEVGGDVAFVEVKWTTRNKDTSGGGN